MLYEVRGVGTPHQYNPMQSVIALEQGRLTSVYLENVHLAPMDAFRNLPGANLKSKYQQMHGEGWLPTIYLGKAAPGAGEWGMGIAVIREKIASDLYYFLGQGTFHIPESYLSYQLLNDPYTAPRIAEFPGVAYPLRTLRIMSRWMNDFSPMKFNHTTHGGETMRVMDFIFANHRPPETLRIPDDQWDSIPEIERNNYQRDVPIYGLMSLLAVGRVLADTDVIGYDGDNVGIVWERDSQNRIIAAKAVKIDPGQSFNFAGRMEKGLTIFSRGAGIEYGDINLDCLSDNQRNEFRFALKKSLDLLRNLQTLHFLFLREGSWSLERAPIQHLMNQFWLRLGDLRGLYQDLLS